MQTDVDRERIRQSLQEDSLLELLQRQNGSLTDNPDVKIRQLGNDIKEHVNPKLVSEFREPIEVNDFTVGYIALLYEIVNDTAVEDELDDLKENGEKRLNNR